MAEWRGRRLLILGSRVDERAVGAQAKGQPKRVGGFRAALEVNVLAWSSGFIIVLIRQYKF